MKIGAGITQKCGDDRLFLWCEHRKCKCWINRINIFLTRKTGNMIRREPIARRTGLRWLGCTQKVQMVKRTPRNPTSVTQLLVWESEISKYKAKVCTALGTQKQLIQLQYADNRNSQGNYWESTSRCNREQSANCWNPARSDVLKGTLYIPNARVCREPQKPVLLLTTL